MADKVAVVVAKQTGKPVDRFGQGDVAEGLDSVAPHPLGFILKAIEKSGNGMTGREADIAQDVGGGRAQRPFLGSQRIDKAGYGCGRLCAESETGDELARIRMRSGQVVVELRSASSASVAISAAVPVPPWLERR